VEIEHFSGQIRFESSASLIALNNTETVLRFLNGSGFGIFGLNVSFASRPMLRVGAHEAVCVYDSTDTLFRDVYIDGSAAAGLLHCRSVRPVVMAATVRNTMADGVHFCNCADARAIGIVTEVSPLSSDRRGACECGAPEKLLY
jgi:hypothetical protein